MRELAERVEALAAAGVRPDAVLLDPGFGFAKNAEHNWQLLRRLDEVVALGHRVVVGTSRKTFLGSVGREGTSARPPLERDVATAVTTVHAAGHGVWCVRVHDVVAARSTPSTSSRPCAGGGASDARGGTRSDPAQRRARPGFHGVFEHERREGQEFVVDVELAVDLGPAGASDDLADTVNYGEIGAAALAAHRGRAASTSSSASPSSSPQDALAHPSVDEVTVTVHKPQAPIGVPFDDVTVSVTRRREPVPVVIAVGANLPWGLSSPHDTASSAIESLAHHPRVRVVASSALLRQRPGRRPRAADLRQRRRARTHLPLADVAAARAARHRGRLRPPARGAVGRSHARPRPRAVRRPGRRHRRHLRPARLTLPHPRAHERAFVLLPWLEVDPDAVLRHAGRAVPVAELVAALDTTGVRPHADDPTEPSRPRPARHADDDDEGHES